MLGSRLDSHDWAKISNVNVSRARAGHQPCSRVTGLCSEGGCGAGFVSRASLRVCCTRQAPLLACPLPLSAAATGWVSLQFEGGRSAEEIRKFWQNWEHPSINKQEWTEQEVGQLQAIAAKHGHLQWQNVAEELGVRTGL